VSRGQFTLWHDATPRKRKKSPPLKAVVLYGREVAGTVLPCFAETRQKSACKKRASTISQGEPRCRWHR